jgi:multiple sugar transport system substrate-binding protein
MWSQGEPILKDGKVNFDGEAGLAALEQMKSLFRECDMPNLSAGDAGVPFNSGEGGNVFLVNVSRRAPLNVPRGTLSLKPVNTPVWDEHPWVCLPVETRL